MKNPLPHLAIASFILIAAPAVNAELPAISEKPWLGHFLGIRDKKIQFGIEANGSAVLEPLNRDGEPVNMHNPIKVKFEILETQPDGKIVSKNIKPESLESASPAVADPKETVVITGKVTGDATFAIAITPERGGVSLSGKVTDKGTLTNPLSFAISLDVLPYKNVDISTDDKKQAFEKKLKRDEMKVSLITGKKEKLDFIDEKNPAILFKDGATFVGFETSSYNSVGIELTASDKSKITFEDKGNKPLWDSFSLRWTPTEGADPGLQKLTIIGK